VVDWLIWHLIFPVILAVHPVQQAPVIEVPADYRACDTCLSERERRATVDNDRQALIEQLEKVKAHIKADKDKLEDTVAECEEIIETCKRSKEALTEAIEALREQL